MTVADPLALRVPKVKQKIDVKGIKEFYENQNESIQLLLKPVEDHVREAKEEQGDTRVRYVYSLAPGPVTSAEFGGRQIPDRCQREFRCKYRPRNPPALRRRSFRIPIVVRNHGRLRLRSSLQPSSHCVPSRR